MRASYEQWQAREKALYEYLKEYFKQHVKNPSPACWPSVPEVAKELGISNEDVECLIEDAGDADMIVAIRMGSAIMDISPQRVEYVGEDL